MSANDSSYNLTRRDFTTMAVAAAVAPAAVASAAPSLTEAEVTIRTDDGTCDAFFVHPSKGRHPGILIWTDAFGLRPTFKDMARRLAGQGYSVLVPNPYYRTQKAPVLLDASGFDFKSTEGRAQLNAWMSPINQPGAAERDAVAYVAWLDTQHAVDKRRKIGTQGYCMGGALVFKTAAQAPQRIGAGATFHGAGLVTEKPDSPHLLVPKMKANMLVAIAGSDDARQPDAKDVLRKSFADVHAQANVEVYTTTIHGWCVRDMPLQNGKPIYDAAEADRAWSELLALYRTSLA